MSKFATPVLFDANIIIDFKGQLGKLFCHFENILIHEKVYSEVLDQAVKNELDMVAEKTNIKYVKDFECIDDNTCLSCLLSRMDKNIIDFKRRRCVFDYHLNDENCLQNRKEYKKKIRNMEM